ncbi:MAG: restriction endonuclease [Deltaproteobacteria bacterium]|nr:restriction endonuclease [Deltaproteobacteria bacterium]
MNNWITKVNLSPLSSKNMPPAPQLTHDIDLNLNIALGEQYKSETQKARVISEAWTEKNAFCFLCGGALLRGQNNARVLDFTCMKCKNGFELKSTRGNFSSKLPDGAFSSMMNRLTDKSSPDFFFLTYDVKSSCVTNFFAVPTYFIDSTIVEKRKPLGHNARRAGWVGCNIIMKRIPEAGKVFYVRNREIQERSKVIETWGRTTFLRGETSLEARGWALEIIRIIESLNVPEFTLQRIYGFEAQLKQKFPRNNFIRAKIRQQLQVLRDAGFIEFVGRGHYASIFYGSVQRGR